MGFRVHLEKENLKDIIFFHFFFPFFYLGILGNFLPNFKALFMFQNPYKDKIVFV